MKGYCKCGVVIDEVVFTRFGMCEKCYERSIFEGLGEVISGDEGFGFEM